MEYVVVRFAESRDVLIDGVSSGRTGATLEVQEGHHHFKLAGADNYRPAAVTTAVTGTTSITPMEITFELAAASGAGGTDAHA